MVHHIDVLLGEGAEVVGSSHDEIIIEVNRAKAQDLQRKYDALVETPPSWLDTLPLRVESYLTSRYTKA